MANAIRKPPMKRKITWSAYAADTSWGVKMWRKGKMASGSRAVIEGCIASVIHHTPMSVVTATMRQALISMPEGGGKNSKRRNSAKPAKRPNAWRRSYCEEIVSLVKLENRQ